MYRLISATPSPYARKVRIQLAEKGIAFELVTEVPWNNDTRTPQFNPLEKLPVLICESGETVYESRFVNEWVEFRHPEPPLMPKEKDSILLTKRFEILADGVCDACVLVFWERARPDGARSEEWMSRQLRKRDGGLREISRLLGGKSVLRGQSIYACGHRRWKPFGMAQSAYDRVRVAREICQSGRPAGSAGDAPVVCEYGALRTGDQR